MERTLQVLNDLERDGILSRYAIGGAMGATFYIEPLLTFGLDVIVLLPQTTSGLLTLAPLYEARQRVCRRGGMRDDRGGSCTIPAGV